MSENQEESRKMFRVEKFVPTTCPNPRCFNPFNENKQGENGYLLGTYWLHETRERSEAILASISHSALKTDLIVCGKCRNFVVRIMIEERSYSSREEAEKAVAEEGFVNLQEGEVNGLNMPQTTVYLRETEPIVRTTLL